MRACSKTMVRIFFTVRVSRLAQISIENYTTLIEYILVLFELSVMRGAAGLTQLCHAQGAKL